MAPGPFSNQAVQFAGMRPTLEDGLRALEEATELAKGIRVDLTDDHLRLIAAVEALPENQSGAQKSGRWLGSRAYGASSHAGVSSPQNGESSPCSDRSGVGGAAFGGGVRVVWKR